MTRSLSNLYKPWFVRTNIENARVINSDAVLVEHIEKGAFRLRQEPQEEEADGDGFTEGIIAPDGSNVVKSEPEFDYEMLAKEEAVRVITEARDQAEEIISEAEAETEEIREAARRQGYEDGKADLRRELEEIQRNLEESFEKKTRKMEQEYRIKQESMERDLVEVIVKVFDRVFHIQFDDKKELLIHLVDNAIRHIEGEKEFRIKVPENSVLFLENHKQEILDRVGHDIVLEFVADSTMDGNDCIIETDSGVFECSLGTQLENLLKDIRSLSS